MSSQPRRPLLSLGLAALATAAACGSEETAVCPDPGAGTMVRFDPTLQELGDNPAENWLAYPFPADHRRTEDGTIDLDDFPRPRPGGDTVELFTDYGKDYIDGFGTNSPVYLSFDTTLDTSDLSTEMAAFLDPQAPLQIVDITPDSPEFGRRRPLRWEQFTVDGKYVAPNTLAVAPAWGFPLRERTTYAFLMTDAVHDVEGQPLATPPLLSVLLGVAPARCASVDDELLELLDTQFAPLRDRLRSEQFDATRIVAATVFTTQSVTSELAAVYDDIQSLPTPSLDPSGWQEIGGPGVFWQENSFQWKTTGGRTDYWVMEGRYQAPNYQVGTVPYVAMEDGGQFNFVDGQPEPARWESLRFVLTIPKAPPRDGQCYPIVEYAHGTTGTAGGFTYPEGGRHAARRLATIGIDQPLHGLRWSGSSNDEQVSFFTFNVLNPHAARTMFRQSAADSFYLTRFIQDALFVPAAVSPTGADICFDSDRISFFGHSQGGMSGALVAAFEDKIDSFVLSGAGGGLSITLFERDDDYVDAQGLLRTFLEPAEDEVFTEMHPVVGLVQMLAEVTDMINYSAFWGSDTTFSSPKNLLLTSGELDAATPHRSAAALALAGRVPVVEPVAIPVPGFAVAGIPPAVAPVVTNLGGRTLGFMQWRNDSPDPDWSNHYLVYHRPEAINASMRLLESGTFEPAARLERDPNTDVR